MSQENIDSWFGTIDILSIQNIPSIDRNPESEMLLFEDKNIKFVHYPDCQQMIIWLPEYFSNYNYLLIRKKRTEEIIFEKKVTEVINGSIQIIIDSLFILPGAYELIITNISGDKHIIEFIKRDEDYIIPIAPGENQSASSLQKILNEIEMEEHEPIIYRDGTGKILPNEDLELRAKILNDIVGKFTRRVEYEGNLRAGSIIYIEGDKRVKFDTEMGGGNCLFFVFIPTSKQWEKATKLPLSERVNILEFIAISANRDQASSCYYEITEDYITYYHR